MVAVLVVRDIAGKIIGRCTARCYNAKGPVCKCCCQGKNHSLGADALSSLVNIDDMLDEIEAGRSVQVMMFVIGESDGNPVRGV